MRHSTSIKDFLLNIISNSEKGSLDLNFNFIPKEEAKFFLASLKNINKVKGYFELNELSKEEIEKWSIIFLLLHDFFHSLADDSSIEKLETKITPQMFVASSEILNENQKLKLASAYILLGIETLNNFHHSPYFISEKIVLGESYFQGVFEPSLWGVKINHSKFFEVTQKLNKKIETESLERLIANYKNFKFDVLKLK
ncbi:hypothetical protein HRbin35_00311 [bacterium HR35]|nr:hypothetical protein HRbin35_00311 [bacterium HR35]